MSCFWCLWCRTHTAFGIYSDILKRLWCWLLLPYQRVIILFSFEFPIQIQILRCKFFLCTLILTQTVDRAKCECDQLSNYNFFFGFMLLFLFLFSVVIFFWSLYLKETIQFYRVIVQCKTSNTFALILYLLVQCAMTFWIKLQMLIEKLRAHSDSISDALEIDAAIYKRFAFCDCFRSPSSSFSLLFCSMNNRNFVFKLSQQCLLLFRKSWNESANGCQYILKIRRLENYVNDFLLQSEFFELLTRMLWHFKKKNNITTGNVCFWRVAKTTADQTLNIWVPRCTYMQFKLQLMFVNSKRFEEENRIRK